MKIVTEEIRNSTSAPFWKAVQVDGKRSALLDRVGFLRHVPEMDLQVALIREAVDG